MKLTHTVGQAALKHVCPTLDHRLSDEQIRRLAASLGTSLHLVIPRIDGVGTAFFIGQCAHESGEFQWPRELWGPSAAQAGYWSRRELQGDGPLSTGLGFHYRGGGWLQTTGRANYRLAATRLRAMSIHAPSARWLAAQADEPEYASVLPAIWWHDNFPARMAGRYTTRIVSAKVNGRDPANGLAEREKYTDRAFEVRDRLKPHTINR